MKSLFRLALSAAVLSGAACAGLGAPAAVDDRVDWPAFLARHDLVWNTLPGRWREGAFLDNGMLGLMIYQPAEPHGGHFFGWTYRPEEKNSLCFDVGRRDVCDHRDGRRTLVHEARLPIGHFLLTPVGAITGGDVRLDLWNAEARGTLITDRGRIAWRAVAPSERNVMVIEVDPSPGERACAWQWVPAISESTRLYKGRQAAFSGYSFTGAASMYASMDRGDKALAYLHDFLDHSVTPNTMSLEAESPVIETPLSGAESIHDMLLQSWSTWEESNRGKPALSSMIRVFPGMPASWKDTVFHDLRAENAFLISARREEGRTRWVRVKSLAGKPCRIKPSLNGEVRALDVGQNDRISRLGNGVYALHLDAGEEIVLYSSTTRPSPMVAPIDGRAAAYNHFGSGHADHD